MRTRRSLHIDWALIAGIEDPGSFPKARRQPISVGLQEFKCSAGENFPFDQASDDDLLLEYIGLYLHFVRDFQFSA